MSPTERAVAAGWRRHDALTGGAPYWERPAKPAEAGGSLINTHGRVDVCWAHGSGWYAPDADRCWLRDEDEALAAALNAAGVP